MTTVTTTRERPILFGGEMVRAILDGRKVQTRRIVKPQPEHGVEPCHWSGTGWARTSDQGGCSCRPVVCPYGQPGDALWLRETWKPCLPDVIEYRADGARVAIANAATSGITWRDCRWRPSIFMTRWASRITLEITGVRVERLNDISAADAKAEGVDADCPVGHIPAYEAGPHAYCFAQLWDRINGERAPWAANPFVWVIEFRRV